MPRNGGYDSLHKWEAENSELPLTLATSTGGGGMHLFYKAPEMAHVGSGKWLQGVEYKAGSNGYVILPPWQHISGVAIAGETGY